MLFLDHAFFLKALSFCRVAKTLYAERINVSAVLLGFKSSCMRPASADVYFVLFPTCAVKRFKGGV